MNLILLFLVGVIGSATSYTNPIVGHVYGNTKNIGSRIITIAKRKLNRVTSSRVIIPPIIGRFIGNMERLLCGLSLHKKYENEKNCKKQVARSKLARGSAISKKCNSRCAAKTPCNKRCQIARDRYQLKLAKSTYTKNNVKKYTSSQINQRQYSGKMANGSCNSRCQASKSRYQKQRTQYEKTFHEPCQNGHIKNTGTINGKPLSDQGNPTGNTPGDKTTIGGYGGVAKGRPLGAPGAGQINWPNSAKYNWRTECKSYTGGPP
jgi:hypothetical protein